MRGAISLAATANGPASPGISTAQRNLRQRPAPCGSAGPARRTGLDLRRPALASFVTALLVAAAAACSEPERSASKPGSPAEEVDRASDPRRGSSGSPTPSPAAPPATATGAAASSAARGVGEAAGGPKPPPRIGLWVPCEGQARVLDDAGRNGALIRIARELEVTDLFVQVVRGGRAWYKATIPDDAPYRRARASSGGQDPLAALISRARQHNLRVHAWVNVLSLATRRETAFFKRLGREAAQVDRYGRSVLDYPDFEIPYPERRWLRMGTRQLWIDPAAPGVVETWEALVEELLRGYPDLSGLHLDYIRYPDVLPPSPGATFGVGMDFGYGVASRRRFHRETGVRAPFGRETRHGRRWDAWRRAQVDEVVRRVAARARDVRPGVQISAAVWAYADRGYLALFQDWRHWLAAEWLDFAVPMAYTRDHRLLGYLAHSALGGADGDRVWVGLGTWLFAEQPAVARRQLEQVRALEPSGVALFSYDALGDNAALREALAPERPATPPSGADAGANPAAP